MTSRSGTITRLVLIAPESPEPREAKLAWAMQQDNRRAVPSRQHGSRDAGQHQALLGGGGRVQQLLAGVSAARIPAAITCIRIAEIMISSAEPSSTDARRATRSSRRDIHPSGRGGEWVDLCRHIRPSKRTLLETSVPADCGNVRSPPETAAPGPGTLGSVGR